MKLSNLKIGARLALGFGIVIALLIAITVLSNVQVGRLNGSLDDIVKVRYPATELANTVQIQVNKIAIDLRDLLLTNDDEKTKLLGADAAAADKKMNESLRLLGENIRSENGKDLYNQAVAARDNYLPARDKLLKLALDHDEAEGRIFLQTDFIPVQAKYFIALDALSWPRSARPAMSKAAASTRSAVPLRRSIRPRSRMRRWWNRLPRLRSPCRIRRPI